MNMRIINTITIIILVSSSLVSQEWDFKSKHLFAVGQENTQIGAIRVVNTSDKSWSNSTKISIFLPNQFPAEWITSSSQILLKNDQTTRSIIKGTNAFVIDNDKQSITIVNTPTVKPGDILIIKGLSVGNFVSESDYGGLSVSINENLGNQVRNINILHRLQKIRMSSHIGGKLIPRLLFNSMKEDIIEDSKGIVFSKAGLLAITKVSVKLSEPITLPKGANKNSIPAITINNGSIHKLDPINDIFSLEFPSQIISDKDNINVTPRKYIRSFSIRGPELKIVFKRTIPKNQELIIEGLILSRPNNIEKAAHPINFNWSNSRSDDHIRLKSASEIFFGNVSFKMNDNIELVANSGPRVVPEIRIKDDEEFPLLKKGSSIIIIIPEKVLVFWNTKLNKAELGGSAAPKVQNTLNYESNKKLRLNVIENFDNSDELLINGLSVYARRRNQDDINEGRILEKNVSVKIERNENYIVNMLNKAIQIIEIDITMDSDQVILRKDDYEDFQPVKISLESQFTAFKTGDSLRVQIPHKLDADWSYGINIADITGVSANKIDPKIRIDRRYPKAVIFTVTENFEGKEEFIISGLGLESIGTESQTEINLFLNDADIPIASTNNKVLIRSPILAMADDQIIFKEDKITNLFTLELNPNGLTNYFANGNYFDLIIPRNSPIHFNTDIASSSGIDLSLNQEIQYLNNKTARFTIQSSYAPGSVINISGIELAQATNFSAGNDTLLLSIDDKPPTSCRNSYEIVTKSSEFKRSEYYFKLIESNLRKGEILVLELEGNLVWDPTKTSIKYNDIAARGMLNFKKPEYSADYKTLSLDITESYGEEDIFRLSGLFVTYNTLRGDTYVSLKFNNLNGEQKATLRYPITYWGRKPVLPRVVPKFLTESYTKPLIRLVGERGGSVSDKKLTQSMNATGNRYFELPELVIQNGALIRIDNNNYKEYKSYLSNIDSRIRSKRYDEAEQFAEKLIRLSPKTWIGYYKKAEIYKEQNELLSESRNLYQRAIQLGYLASEDYPVLYDDDINSQAGKYIAEARQLITNREFIDAEKRLYTVLSMPDSLNPVYKGNANFLLGEIALALNDCKWAARFFQNSYITNVSDQDVYDFRQASLKLTECLDNNQYTSTISEFVSITEPIVDFNSEFEEIQISFNTNVNYPNTIGIYNNFEGQKDKPLEGNNYTVKDNYVYQLSVKPIRVQIIALATVLGISGFLIGTAL